MQYAYLVPRLSALNNIDKKQAAIHDYLLAKNIIKPILISKEDSLFEEACYPVAEGLMDVLSSQLDQQTKKSLYQQITGMAYRLEPREFYWTGLPSSAVCPQCHSTVGDSQANGEHQAFDWVNMWLTGKDKVTCPACQHTADINAYDFQEPAAFSNFSVVFFNGVSADFSAAFLQDLAAIIGVPILGLDQKQ